MSEKILCIILCFALLSGCKSKDKKNEKLLDDNTSAVSSDKPTEVKAKPVRNEMFNYELVSNGTVAAQKKADLKFQSSDIVTHIFVKNGDRVAKGQKLASLDAFKLQKALEQSRDIFERAKLDLQDVLIGQGYSLKNQESIPDDVMKIAKVKSNYDQNRINYEMAEYNLKSATLRAPFSGIVANLDTKENNIPTGTNPFCTIVDVVHPEVVFMVLENELSFVRKGDGVLVSPFSSDESALKGKVTEINPIVDKNGMVQIKASVENPQSKLYDGMNVRIRVQRAVDKQLLIPKSALVLRNGRKVVFTYKKGLAQWVYVQTSLENSESYVVTEGLNQGDSVIYEGNINLAHESPVVLK